MNDIDPGGRTALTTQLSESLEALLPATADWISAWRRADEAARSIDGNAPESDAIFRALVTDLRAAGTEIPGLGQVLLHALIEGNLPSVEVH